MEKVQEFRADRFASLTLWFHFCNTYQLDLCPRCQRGARQPHSSPVPSWRWICNSCSSESAHLPLNRKDSPLERADAVAAAVSPHHGVGSKPDALVQAKLAFPKFKNRVA